MFQNKTKKNQYAELDSVIEKLMKETACVGTEKQSNTLFALLLEMLSEYNNACKNELGNSEIMNGIFNRVQKQFHSFSTSFRRKNEIRKCDKCVEPEEKSIGYRWELVKVTITGKTTRQIVQCTYQYVSIIKQLEGLFSDTEFCNIYMNHQQNHKYNDGQYQDGCCGSMFKKNQVFQSCSSAIQLQIYTDEFDPCDPLKTKAGIHKTTAFYMQIRNLPREYLSRLNSIYLIALCNSNDKNE